ncbi:MAG TPA: hypothetical protein PLZ51_19685, partial [Aggregatilineales bacterium]|nr:hypothetical protein [Aggregatilineales bacterium]
MSLNSPVLPPTISINRVKMMVAPDMPISLQGKMAYEILSRRALITEIHQNMPMLVSSPDPIPEFDALLIQKDPVALSIAQTFAMRLFWLIHILKFPHPDNQMARPEWDEGYWATFARLKQIIFGGGLMRGALGAHMVAYAQQRLGDAITLKIAPHAQILPLLGASRHVPEDTKQALIFDFGQTNIKRALATYSEGILTDMHILSTIPALPHAPETTPQRLADHIITTIADTWRDYATANTALFIPISIATYLQNNHPFGDTYYGSITQLAPNMGAFLADSISERIGARVRVLLIHDGTASARVYVGEPDTV